MLYRHAIVKYGTVIATNIVIKPNSLYHGSETTDLYVFDLLTLPGIALYLTCSTSHLIANLL